MFRLASTSALVGCATLVLGLVGCATATAGAGEAGAAGVAGQAAADGGTSSGGSANTGGAKSSTGGAKSSTGGAESSTGGQTGGASGGTGGQSGSGGSTASARPKIGDTNSFGLKLVWAEEFDGPSIDRTVWRNELRQGYNNEEEYLTDSPLNQFIDNGNLVIRGIPSTQYAGAHYTSAFLTTEHAKYFKYGYFEASMKMPRAMGCWPAFWMLPEDSVYGGWPLSGETDIMEYWRYNPSTVWGTANYDNNGYKYTQGGHDLKVDLANAFHTYAVRWTDTKIDWYVDGTKYFSFDISQPIDGRRPFNETFYLILNLAIGGGRGGTPTPSQWPDDLRIDWVRVWQ